VPADALSQVLGALADPIRRELVERLSHGDCTVAELAAPHDVSKQAISKHLRVLEDAGLVSRSGEGHRRPVHLEAQVFDLIDHWVERYRREAELRHQRLDALLARLADEAPRPQTPPHHPRGPRP
jgi:DNA-binding transcriptional ArsR family regulator